MFDDCNIFFKGKADGRARAPHHSPSPEKCDARPRSPAGFATWDRQRNSYIPPCRFSHETAALPGKVSRGCPSDGARRTAPGLPNQSTPSSTRAQVVPSRATLPGTVSPPPGKGFGPGPGEARTHRRAARASAAGTRACRRSPLRFAPAAPLVARSVRYILWIIAWPKPEQETWVAPSIRRAKS